MLPLSATHHHRSTAHNTLHRVHRTAQAVTSRERRIGFVQSCLDATYRNIYALDCTTHEISSSPKRDTELDAEATRACLLFFKAAASHASLTCAAALASSAHCALARTAGSAHRACGDGSSAVTSPTSVRALCAACPAISSLAWYSVQCRDCKVSCLPCCSESISACCSTAWPTRTSSKTHATPAILHMQDQHVLTELWRKCVSRLTST